jgi:hypothetical protein
VPAAGAAIARLKSARDIAARLVGGDPTNKSVCHPIRWPGTWHRKGEPRLCVIDTANPDIEIDLDAALEKLTAVAGREPVALKYCGQSLFGSATNIGCVFEIIGASGRP